MTEVDLTPKEIGGFRILRRLANGSTSDVLLARAEGPHGCPRVVAPISNVSPCCPPTISSVPVGASAMSFVLAR